MILSPAYSESIAGQKYEFKEAIILPVTILSSEMLHLSYRKGCVLLNGSDLTDYVDKGVSQPDDDQDVRIIDMTSYPVKDVLDILLQDKTTGKNIIWATDAYKIFGFGDKSCISPNQFKVDRYLLQPRINKSAEEQQERTRKKAEVFTPVWLCNRMNNYCDEQWFGRKDVFNHENEDNTWTVIEDKVQFPEGKDWKDYVDSRRLEITCGEAPYLVSRYDASTGEFILPPLRRIGILDRKLRIVNENTSTEEDWIDWSIRALQSCYGYEWQGDSLLIARINFLMTFYDYYRECWSKDPEMDVLKQVANIIAWNLWQMDGLKDSVPFGRPAGTKQQMTFDSFFDGEQKSSVGPAQVCKINNWRSKESLQFRKCKDRGKMSKKMFDFVIGNPPYQENTDSNCRSPPVYHLFMEEAYKTSNSVELITPARFLFEAGQTPKEWNKKMLNDPHFKVLFFEPDSSVIFPSTDIKGGIVVSYRDESKSYDPIVTFTQFPELKTILAKVNSNTNSFLSDIISSQGIYRFTQKALLENPSISQYVGAGTGDKIGSGIVEQFPSIFIEESKLDSSETTEYVAIYAKIKEGRVRRFIRKDYIQYISWLDSYNVLIAQANNSGSFGEVLSPSLIAAPGEGNADTFICMGQFETEAEAKAALRYLSTKFLRALLGIKKVTQNNPKSVWVHIPLQDFSSNSDIDWNDSITHIDQQLYQKYGFSVDEIHFIESHVQEMD